MSNIIMVGIGGGLGAIFRYLISTIPLKSSFPFLTFVTNFIGAVLIGFIVSFSIKNFSFSKNQFVFWKTGFCGGFTTFSTFSLEAVSLFKDGKLSLCMIYTTLSVVACFLGIFLGEYLYSLVFERWKGSKGEMLKWCINVDTVWIKM